LISGHEDGSSVAFSATDSLAATKSIRSLSIPDGTAFLVLANRQSVPGQRGSDAGSGSSHFRKKS
jgi:hypothetical protein